MHAARSCCSRFILKSAHPMKDTQHLQAQQCQGQQVHGCQALRVEGQPSKQTRNPKP